MKITVQIGKILTKIQFKMKYFFWLFLFSFCINAFKIQYVSVVCIFFQLIYQYFKLHFA